MSFINKYDEYGKPQSGNVGRFQYTGQMWLNEVGVYYYKARDYQPGLGRFLQTDPIGYDAGANLYAFVLNDPVNLADPLGLQACGGAHGPCPPPRPGDVVVTGRLSPRVGSAGRHILANSAQQDQVHDTQEIIVTAPKRKRLSPCMISFLRANGLDASNLSDIAFVGSMKSNFVTRWAERRGHGAITLGNKIYVSPTSWGRITNPAAGPTYFEEIVHAIQWKQSGKANFLLSYGLGIPFGHDNHVEAQAMGISKRLHEAYLAPNNRRC